MKYIWIVLIVLIALFSIFPSNSANIQDVNTEKELEYLKIE